MQSPNDLPAGAGQPHIDYQLVSSCNEGAIQTKSFQDKPGEIGPCGRVVPMDHWHPAPLTTWCHIDNMLSIIIIEQKKRPTIATSEPFQSLTPSFQSNIIPYGKTDHLDSDFALRIIGTVSMFLRDFTIFRET
jgi:hypothetical protein